MLEKENEEGETEHIPMLKTFTVFNVQQIDNLAVEYAALPAASFDPIEKAEALTAPVVPKLQRKAYRRFTVRLR